MIGPPPAVRAILPAGALVLGQDQADPSGLAAGRPVVLTDSRPGARARLRRRAGRLGLTLEGEHVVLPTWGSAAFVVEDDRHVVGWLWDTLATVPPRARRSAPLVELAVRLGTLGPVRRALLWGAPGRVLVGRVGGRP